MKRLAVNKLLILLPILMAASFIPLSSHAEILSVSYTDARDNTGGSGLKQVHLIVKKDGGSWLPAGLTSNTPQGSFAYDARFGDGIYNFAVQVEDMAGNTSSLNASPIASYLLDTKAPTAATAKAPATVNSSEFTVSYVGATDSSGGSGVAKVELWVKKDTGSWGFSGFAIQSSSESGSFLFNTAVAGQYYFATRVYDNSGNASAIPSGNGSASTLVSLSEETDLCPLDPKKMVPGLCGCGVKEDSKDRDKDGIINCLDLDNDNDGVSDQQEAVDGTDPYDSGSVLDILGTNVCSEWNGFLDGMWNILELSNNGSETIKTTTTLYSLSGTVMSRFTCAITSGSQCDVLVHGMEGRTPDSFGKICTSHDGNPGDLNGRMVYYKSDNTAAAGELSFQFAFAMPLANGKMGNQFLSFNTYQPSMSATDQSNLVANWIQVTNLSSKQQEGSLTFYNQAGAVLGEMAVVLAPEQRADFSGHQFGTGLVGQVAWRPNSKTARFSVRNVRYLYDNAFGANSFDTAFQLAGLHGSGTLLSVPVDTRSQTSVIELLNTSDVMTSSTVKIYDEVGVLVHETVISLDAFQSFHLIIDPILGAGKRGIATIKSDRANSLVAIAMQYGRNADNSIAYMYGLPAVPAVGSVLSGSYNTFLSQTSELVILNPKSSVQTVTINTTSGSGDITAEPVTLSIPAHGIISVNLNQFDAENRYGTVTVQSDTENSLVAWVLRSRGSDYIMPTPVMQ